MEYSIYEKSKDGRRGVSFPKLDVGESPVEEWVTRKSKIGLASVSELDVVRHYTRLSQLNFSIDTHFYPLGSCTMKYNPKINEWTASLDGFANIHPYQPAYQVQGALEVIWQLENELAEITGFPYVSLSPNAGAQGEFAGVAMIKKYFEKKGEQRNIALIPDSAHGTNPATAAMVGFKTVQVKSNANGTVDLEHLKEVLTPEVACIMLTNPNTLGIFEKDILEISKLMKENGSLLYYDGANLNAIVGRVRPKDMGFDVMHINLHKTFSTPHGGGGPGSGPVCVSEKLKDFLPYPRVVKNNLEENVILENEFEIEDINPDTIGRLRWFYGNFLIILRAYTYIKTLGKDGIENISEMAVLNANYLKEILKKSFLLPFDQPCMHEFVLSAKKIKQDTKAMALDIAKRMIDYGIHPPTVYFPLIVPEALMIEPTETESKETLDNFIEVLETILNECYEDIEKVKNAPANTPVQRLNETKAVKEPRLTI